MGHLVVVGFKRKRRIKRKGFTVALRVQEESDNVVAFGRPFEWPIVVLFM